jgi:hypothetical protein
MPDVGHGEAVLKGLADYPLPPQPGVRDYVFYLAATDHPGYGSSAKFLFDTFYKDHHAHTEVESLEGLIKALHTDVTQNGVQAIREIVIVAHGTPLGMNFRVLDTTGDQQMRQVTPLSLSDLQDLFSTGQADAATFAAQRAVVLKHLAPDAWVTLRVCRFGQSDEGMYSMYSFFGGNVNVYAPVKFQTFAGVFLRPGTRFPNRLAYHEHLVRQRFVPRGKHTPNRAEAIVRAMEDPQSFSDPFVLATRPLEGAEPPAYGQLLDGLNAASLNAGLRSGFDHAGFALTAHAKAKVRVRDSSWTVTDTLTEDQDTYPVEYAVDQEIDITGGQRRLVAQGTVVGDFAEVPYQTFLDEDEHKRFNGELLTLAYRVDDDPPDAENVKHFDALSALLAANGTSGTTFDTGDVDLRALLAAEDPSLEPSPAATIALVSQPADGSMQPTIWLVGPTVEDTMLEIHLVHLYTDARVPVRMYTVVLHFRLDKNGLPVEQASYQQYVLTTAGTNLDSPGVELAASLDRLSIDDLVDLISYLNTPYDPERVVVLHQAQQALRRKSGFEAWMTARFPDANDIPFPSGDPLTELSLGRKDDVQARVYLFWFDGNWRQVKETVRPRPVFHDDLFLEEPLTDRFSNLDSWAEVVLPQEDSPAADARETQGRRTPGQQRYATTPHEKDTFTPRDDRAACEKFRAAIRKIKDLQDLPADQLTAALAETTPDGTSYFHIAVEVAGTYGILRNLAFLTKVAHLPEVPSNSYELAKFIAKPIVEHVGWELGVTILEFLESDVVILIPWEMWKHFLETQAEAVERNEAYGRLTGARTWLEELDTLARRDPSALTESLRIELSGRSNDEVIKAYEYELHDGVHTRFMLFIADFHHGFDEGGARMQELWPEILRTANEVMGKTLFENSMDSCRMTVLIEEGFVDLDAVRADVVRQVVQRLLNELPHVR